MTKCRICGCTDERACPAGCGWEPYQGDICSVCAAFKRHLEAYNEDALKVSAASLARLFREVLGRDQPPTKERRP
jgi:hypothetical protein